MSVPHTLQNKPRVNYAILHSGLEDTLPEKSQLELENTPPVKDEAALDDQAELDALDMEKAALATELQKLHQEQALLDKKREVESLREAVTQLQLEQCSSSGMEKVKVKDRKVKSVTTSGLLFAVFTRPFYSR